MRQRFPIIIGGCLAIAVVVVLTLSPFRDPVDPVPEDLSIAYLSALSLGSADGAVSDTFFAQGAPGTRYCFAVLTIALTLFEVATCEASLRDGAEWFDDEEMGPQAVAAGMWVMMERGGASDSLGPVADFFSVDLADGNNLELTGASAAQMDHQGIFRDRVRMCLRAPRDLIAPQLEENAAQFRENCLPE